MKKLILAMLLASAASQTNAQVIIDSVSIRANYANQLWYSLPNGTQDTAVKSNWDLAFDVSGMGGSVLTNSVIGTIIWKYPKVDTSGWATVDTSGLTTWTAHYNSDTSWALGAMGRYTNPANPFDLDWGIYNLTTHVVTGDSIYIIKLATGVYKKLWIVSLSGSVYTFKYANLDGTSPQTATINKANYTGKNFAYYSLQSNAALDREPLSANWDIVFTQHTAFIPMPYTVTGVLSNIGVQVAKVSGVSNKTTYSDYNSAAFSSAINVIGYSWKTYNGSGYSVQDSLVYFVKPISGNIWKMIFTGFNNLTGMYFFTKQKLVTSAVPVLNGAATASLAMYPNPSNGQAVHIAYSFDANVPKADISVFDITGKIMVQAQLDNTSGLHQYQLQNLHTGVYVVVIETNGAHVQQKLIVQ